MAKGAPELVIFDCDGVLVDSERISVEIEAQVLERLGWPMSKEEVVERFMGRSQEYIVREIETHLGRKLPDDWEREFQHLYDDAFEARLEPVDGIPEALGHITAQTCVASSGSHEKIRKTLGLTGLYGRFEGRIFSADEVTNGKPAPDLFLHAARSLSSVKPSDCAVVEDSPAGVEASQAAGMRTFAYAGGLVPAHQLAIADTVVFEDMRDLPHLLGDLNQSTAPC